MHWSYVFLAQTHRYDSVLVANVLNFVFLPGSSIYLVVLVLAIIALWWWFCPCRVRGAVWNHTAWLFPLMPLPTLSLFYSNFLFGNEYRKTSLVKILGNFSFVSIYYHWNWFEDLHHVQGIEIKDDSEMLHSQYLRENNGTTCHHGHPADCQLALTNVVEVQRKVVTND